jgi:2'-5' RNA ligase/AraC-like DNA-binding protein
MGNTGQCPRLDAKLYSVILEKCLAFMGLPNTYSFIGGRACGMAYLSGDKVYKITTDKSEAFESKKVVGKNNNHLVNIYSVKQIHSDLTNTEVYLIIMEHLRTNRSAIFKEIEDQLMRLFKEELGITLFDLIHQYRFQPAYYKNQYAPDVNVILDEHQREKHYYNSLLQIVDELKANGIESIDVQYHNLGLKPSGNIAFFDMGMGDMKGQVSTIQVQEETGLDEEIKDLMSAMKQDGTTIEQLATKLSQRLGFGQSKILGKGTQGFAVDVGNNTVMKITTDESEATETSKLIGKQAKYLGNVFKVYRMNQPYQKSFVILRELLRVDENENKRRFQILTDVMRDHGISIHDYTTSFDGIVMKGDRVKLKQYAELIGQLPEEHFKIVNDFFNIFNELIDFGIKSADFTGSNFGFKPNGVYAYYDLGYSDNDSVGDLDVIDINERITSYMKNSSAVNVKKKCHINGNGDGTSAACNQGDIKNIELSKIDEGQDVKIEYGALMLNFDIKKWKEITSIIEEDDVYDEPTFGVETEPHVTILYGFHEEVTAKEVEDLLKEKHDPADDIEIELLGISHFETPKYDVVKFDVKSDKLTELNKLVKKLPFTSDYPDYQPHMTISYVKKGRGKKYDEKIDEPIKLKSNNIVYSTVDSVKTTINEHTSQWNKRLQKKEKMLA